MRQSQEKNDTSGIFLRRSDTLAQKLGVNVDELPDILGVSRASLYGYRRGKRKVSNKAWAKLEAAEKDAGISPAAVASSELNREFVKIADQQGLTEKEKQAEYERLMDMKTPLIEEVIRLREENKMLKNRIGVAVGALQDPNLGTWENEADQEAKDKKRDEAVRRAKELLSKPSKSQINSITHEDELDEEQKKQA